MMICTELIKVLLHEHVRLPLLMLMAILMLVNSLCFFYQPWLYEWSVSKLLYSLGILFMPIICSICSSNKKNQSKSINFVYPGCELNLSYQPIFWGQLTKSRYLATFPNSMKGDWTPQAGDQRKLQKTTKRGYIDK